MCSVGYPLPKFWGGSDSWPRLNNSDSSGDAPQQSPTASIIGVCDAPVQVFDRLTIDVVCFVLLVGLVLDWLGAVRGSGRGYESLLIGVAGRTRCLVHYNCCLLVLNLLGDAIYLF